MKPLLSSSLIVASLGTAVAENSLSPAPTAVAPAPSTMIDIEWMASLAVFGGIGGQVGITPSQTPQLRLSAGAFALTLPQFALDEYADMGWTVADKAGIVEARYSLRPGRGGGFVSANALYQRRTLRNDGATGSALLHQYVVAAAIGYEYFPMTRQGLYIVPGFTLAFRLAEQGTPEVGGMTFSKSRVLPLPTVAIGWRLST